MTIQIKDLSISGVTDMASVRGGIQSVSPIAFYASLNFEPSVAFSTKPAASEFTITKTIDRASPTLFT